MEQAEIEEIQFFASLQFSAEEIKLLRSNPVELDEIVNQAALKGEAQIRYSMWKAALSGSGPAQTESLKIIQKRRMNG